MRNKEENDLQRDELKGGVCGWVVGGGYTCTGIDRAFFLVQYQMGFRIGIGDWQCCNMVLSFVMHWHHRHRHSALALSGFRTPPTLPR